MKLRAAVIVLSFLTVASLTSAQSPNQENQAPEYWVDPSTGLMWAGKDNGRDVNWHQAAKYCRDLRLAGYSDWSLPAIGELENIYDKSAASLGRAGQGKGRPFAWHVKGNLFLTGHEWSSTQRLDDRGRPSGLAWFFDFANGIQNDEDAGRITGRLANFDRRALCVRHSGK